MEKLDQQQIKKLNDFVRQVGNDSLGQELEVNSKQVRNDFVTNVDVLNEKKIREFISELRPNAAFIGEELSPDSISLDGEIWIIDPIDGTMNFVKTKDYFGIMVAMFYDGQPVFGLILDITNQKLVWSQTGEGVFINEDKLEPIHRDKLTDGVLLFSAHSILRNYEDEIEIARKALTIRIYEAASISLIRVIEGKAVGYLSGLKTWDVAAGVVIFKELGLPVVNLNGEPIDILNPGQVAFGFNPKEF